MIGRRIDWNQFLKSNDTLLVEAIKFSICVDENSEKDKIYESLAIISLYCYINKDKPEFQHRVDLLYKLIGKVAINLDIKALEAYIDNYIAQYIDSMLLIDEIESNDLETEKISPVNIPLEYLNISDDDTKDSSIVLDYSTSDDETEEILYLSSTLDLTLAEEKLTDTKELSTRDLDHLLDSIRTHKYIKAKSDLIGDIQDLFKFNSEHGDDGVKGRSIVECLENAASACINNMKYLYTEDYNFFKELILQVVQKLYKSNQLNKTDKLRSNQIVVSYLKRLIDQES